MTDRARWIFLSPHLDDAVISCGGLICALGSECDVEVWTLFASAPWAGPYSEVARWLHSVSGGSTGIRLAWRRRREDRAATRKVGAGLRHWKWKDAAYRTGSNGGFLYKDVLSPTWNPLDEKLIQEISARLRSELRDTDILVVPLGVGNHVDHLIVRRAAETALHSRIIYYPDLPYAATGPGDVAKAAGTMSRFSYNLSDSHIQTWIDAIYCYATQIAMLEEAAPSLSDTVHAEVAAHHLALFGGVGVELPESGVWSKR